MTLTNLPNPSSGTDAITLLDGRQLLVYNPVAKGRTPLAIATSGDGKAWRTALTLEDQPGEDLLPHRDPVVRTAWSTSLSPGSESGSSTSSSTPTPSRGDPGIPAQDLSPSRFTT